MKYKALSRADVLIERRKLSVPYIRKSNRSESQDLIRKIIIINLRKLEFGTDEQFKPNSNWSTEFDCET